MPPPLNSISSDAIPDSDLLPPDLLALVARLEKDTGASLRFAARNLQTGYSLRYQAGRPCKTASVIKLPILVHVALAVQEGSFAWEEPLTLTAAEQVPGSGVLTQLTPGLTLSLRDVCMLMTIVSDNTGTNMVIERTGVEPINARMRAMGLSQTRLFRKAYRPDTEQSLGYGLGVTTPHEMLDLLTRLAEGTAGDPVACSSVLAILEAQCYRDAIPRFLPADWSYAGKTGAVDDVRNDVGLVTDPAGRRYALALFCQEIPGSLWTADNPGLLALAHLTGQLLGELACR